LLASRNRVMSSDEAWGANRIKVNAPTHGSGQLARALVASEGAEVQAR
jgi:hypothetical protein